MAKPTTAENKHRRSTRCYCLKVRRAGGDISRYYEKWLAPSGITANQYFLLHSIDKRGACSIQELADTCELDRSTAARNMRPLLRRGLAADTRRPGARNCRLELTAQGRETLAQAAVLWEQAQQGVREQLGEQGLLALEQVLGNLEAL